MIIFNLTEYCEYDLLVHQNLQFLILNTHTEPHTNAHTDTHTFNTLFAQLIFESHTDTNTYETLCESHTIFVHTAVKTFLQSTSSTL